jgi:hypothetical protein
MLAPMKRILVVAVLAACGGSPSSPPQDPVSNAVPPPPPDAAVDAPARDAKALLEEMARFRDVMCACTDKACVERTTQDLTRWGQELARDDSRGAPKMTEDDARVAQEISEALGKCMASMLSKP